MESSKQTELTRKTERLIDEEMTVSRGEGQRVEGLSKRKKDSWTWTTVW